MTDQEKRSLKEANQVERHALQEAERSTGEQVRKKAYLAREQAIEKARKGRETERSQKRATEEIGQLARDKARREAYFATERAIAKAQEARKLKTKKQPPG